MVLVGGILTTGVVVTGRCKGLWRVLNVVGDFFFEGGWGGGGG